MKINWFLTSLISGIVAGFLTYYFSKNFDVSLIVTTIVTVIVLLMNPRYRFWRAFIISISLLGLGNKIFFEAVGEIVGIDFKFGISQFSDNVSIAIVILSIVSLILSYFRDIENVNFSLIKSSRKTVKKVSGNDYSINIQGNNNSVNSISNKSSKLKSLQIIIFSLIIILIMWSFLKSKKESIKKVSGDDYSVNIDGDNNTVTSTVNVLKFNEHDLKPFTESINFEIESLQKRLENKSKIADLDKEFAILTEKLNNLKNQNAFLEAQVKNLLERTENESLDNMPNLFLKAYESFKKGKIEESLKLLDEDKLLKEEIKLKGENVILSNIRLLKARILRVINDFDGAINNYEKAYTLRPNWIIALEQAEIYSLFNKDDDTIISFENAIKLSQTNEQKGISHYNYGIYYSDKNNYDNAKYHLNQALTLSQDIVVDNSYGFKLDKCKVLNVLGTLYNKISIHDSKALKTYEESILIYKKRLDLNMNEYESDYADVLYNYSFLLMQKNNTPKALQYIKELIKIREELYKSKPKEYGSKLADSYDRQAQILMINKKLKKSKELFEKAIFLKRTLAEIDPESLISLEMSLANIGNVMAMLNQPQKAEELYLEALGIIRKLVKVNKKKYIPYQTQLLIQIASFYSKTNKEESIKYLDELMVYLYPERHNSVGFEPYLNSVYFILKGLGIKKDDYLRQRGLE